MPNIIGAVRAHVRVGTLVVVVCAASPASCYSRKSDGNSKRNSRKHLKNTYIIFFLQLIFLRVGLVKVFFLSFFFFILFISVGWGGGARHNSTIYGPKSHLLKKETEPTLGPCACISLYKPFNYLIKAAGPMDLHTKSLAELARKLAAKTQKKICIYGPFTVVTPWVCVAESKQFEVFKP